MLINENVYGWYMTGIIGNSGKWFLGFSQAPTLVQNGWINVSNGLPELNQKVLFETDPSVYQDGILTGFFRKGSSYDYSFESITGFKYSPIDVVKWRGTE